MCQTRTLLRSFSASDRGTVTIIFGLSAIALTAVVGLTLDASRAVNIGSRVQNVLDAASLTAARTLSLEDGDNDEVRQAALAHIEAHADQFRAWEVTVDNPQVEINRARKEVRTTADIRVSSIAGALLGDLPLLAFQSRATASFDVKKIELAMVLDITGSMCDAPPASQADACNGGIKIDALKEAAEDVIKVLSNSSTAPGLIRVGLVPYSGSVNAGPYFGAVTGGAPHGDTCVVERTGSDAFTEAAPVGASVLGLSSTASAWYYSCPPSQIVPMTDVARSSDRNALIDKVKALKGYGGTAGHIGAAWGWYMVSPEWTGVWPGPSDPKPYGDDVTKAVLLMSDGNFNVAYANGGETVPFPDPGSMDVAVPGSSPNQAKQLCDAMKAEKIKIYAVAFQAPASAEALLKDCSGEANFYTADNRNELKAAFRAIADKLTSLKLAH